MKSLHNISELGFGSWQAMCETFFASPIAQSNETELKIKGLGQCQLELWGLTSRRLQACLAIPGVLARCRTPLDVVNAQAKFLEAAFLQGAESTRRMADALTVVTGASNATSIEKTSDVPARDLIALPVGKKSRRSGTARASVKSANDQRRVA